MNYCRSSAAVTISVTDIQLVASELDISKDLAESMLKKNNGDLKATFHAFIDERF